MGRQLMLQVFVFPCIRDIYIQIIIDFKRLTSSLFFSSSSLLFSLLYPLNRRIYTFYLGFCDSQLTGPGVGAVYAIPRFSVSNKYCGHSSQLKETQNCAVDLVAQPIVQTNFQSTNRILNLYTFSNLNSQRICFSLWEIILKHQTHNKNLFTGIIIQQ